MRTLSRLKNDLPRLSRDPRWNFVAAMTSLAVFVVGIGIALLAISMTIAILVLVLVVPIGLVDLLVISQIATAQIDLTFSHGGIRLAMVEGLGESVDDHIYEATVHNVVVTNRSSAGVSLHVTLRLALKSGDVLDVPGCDLSYEGRRVEDPFNIPGGSSLSGILVFRNIFPPDPERDSGETQLNRIWDRGATKIELRDRISDLQSTFDFKRR